MGVHGLRPDHSAAGMTVAIVVSRTEVEIARRLLRGAMARLKERGADEDPEVHWVASAFQVPLLTMQLAESSRFDGVLALSCLPAFEEPTEPQEPLAAEFARGLMHVQLDTGVPIGLALLTATERDQALARSGERANAGARALDDLLETINLQREVQSVDEADGESEV